MLIFWFFDGSVKSKLILESNQQFINILLKGRWGASAIGVYAKKQCDNLIYRILAKDNPKEYPVMDDDAPISTYSTRKYLDRMDCLFSTTSTVCFVVGDPGSCKEVKNRRELRGCDCSDPKNYKFEDEGRFKI